MPDLDKGITITGGTPLDLMLQGNINHLGGGREN